MQTYEGKKVTFGFVISPKAEQVKLLKKDWFKFLGDDYAAVLTDCIHSVIQLDKECNFVKFLSLTENDGAIPLHKVSSYLPLRFLSASTKMSMMARLEYFCLTMVISSCQRIARSNLLSGICGG